MEVTVEIAGGDTHHVDVDEDIAADPATYGDLLDALDLSPHEVSVLVDGIPVPETRAVDSATISVVRLVTGG